MYYIVFNLQIIDHISSTRCPIEMGFGSKCNILNGLMIYIEKSELNIFDMWLIPLDRVTYIENILLHDSQQINLMFLP